jgi:hypothetical protein
MQKVAHCATYMRSVGEILPMHKISDSVRSTHGQDGAIVLDIRQGQMFNLNFVGSRILELVEFVSSDQQIAEAISREFNADIETVKKDLTEFLEELKAHKLVHSANSDGKY